MERKKLLLVAVSVGVVLLIIIGIPLMMIAPRQSPASFPDRDWAAAVEPNDFREMMPRPDAVAEPVIPEYAFTQPEEPLAVTTLTVPVPQTAAVPDVPVTRVQQPASVRLTPTPAVAPSPKPVAVAPQKEAPKPAVTKTTADPGKAYNNYWVQTGAFSTKIRAEGAKESLASQGITSIIDNRDIDGKTWYRVRVGPYMSETEAKYWLALVKAIDGFSESQIRLTQATR
jgi:DedD protein